MFLHVWSFTNSNVILHTIVNNLYRPTSAYRSKGSMQDLSVVISKLKGAVSESGERQLTVKCQHFTPQRASIWWHGNKIQQLILSPELLTHRQFQDTVKNYEQKRKSHERGITIRPLTSFGRTIHPAITVTTCVELHSLVTNWFNVCGETSQDLIANVNVLLWLKQHIYKKHWVWIVAASVVNALCGWMRCVNAKENTQTNPEPVACERQRERETSSWHL